MACMFYFVRCTNIIFNSLLAQFVKYDVHTTRIIKFIHAIIHHMNYYTSKHTLFTRTFLSAQK